MELTQLTNPNSKIIPLTRQSMPACENLAKLHIKFPGFCRFVGRSSTDFFQSFTISPWVLFTISPSATPFRCVLTKIKCRHRSLSI